MSNNALYVYGIIKFGGFNLSWKKIGISGKDVYLIDGKNFSALVHDCEEKPYITEDPEKIKKFILAHNKILDIAMEDFKGVIPLPFNTIIKKGAYSSEYSLKKWLCDDKERLEKIWNKVERKKEYGLRIYYEKNKLIQKTSTATEVKTIEESWQGKGEGLSYLLKEKASSKINEIVRERINQFKQEICNNIKEITGDIKINVSRISINEEKDLLLSLSVLVIEEQISEIIRILEKEAKDFPFQIAGPFAPYSFVENEYK